MLSISICDDDKYHLGHAREIIQEYLDKQEEDYRIELFQTGQELLDYVQKVGNDIDLLFLDIELEDTNGIALCKQVNEIIPYCQIAYLTNHLHYAVDVYDTGHYYYIVKEEFAERLPMVFERFFQLQEDFYGKPIIVTKKANQIVLKQDEIQYVERIKRMSYIYTDHDIFEVKEGIDELHRRLSNMHFVRCHHSYLVCLDKVQEFKRKEFILANGKRIPVSRGYLKSVQSIFLGWAQMQI